jgi:HSP20 family protein
MERDRIKTEPRDGLDVDRARPEEEGAVPLERADAGRWMTYSGARDPWLASHFDFMRHFMREMGRMFEGFPGAGGRTQSLTSWPPIEVFERGNRVVIRAEMPGMRREDIKVRVEDDSLVIEGERKEDREARHEGYFESEWSYGRFARRVRLPAEADPDQVSARFDNGVLEVTLNVPASSRREIPVEVRGPEARSAEPRAEAYRGLRGAIEDRNRDLGPRPSARP